MTGVRRNCRRSVAHTRRCCSQRGGRAELMRCASGSERSHQGVLYIRRAAGTHRHAYRMHAVRSESECQSARRASERLTSWAPPVRLSTEREKSKKQKLSPQGGSNSRPWHYKCHALPLCYGGIVYIITSFSRSHEGEALGATRGLDSTRSDRCVPLVWDESESRCHAPLDWQSPPTASDESL